MKAVLKFNLNKPDEAVEHLRCIKAVDLAIVLFHIQRNLKKEMVNNLTSDEYIEGVEDTIHRINELIEEKGIVIDDILN